MTTIAIIPARGGSKGIINKNIINMNGKPLIHYVLEACKLTSEIDHIVVTTDSDMIASVVLRQYPNVIIVKRPDELAGDYSTSESALIHAIENLDIYDLTKIVFVQATSPLTTNEDLTRLINLLDHYDSSAFYVNDYGVFFGEDNMLEARLPRQKRTPRKREVGNAWAFHKKHFMVEKSRLFGNVGLCKIERPKDLEIDEQVDFDLIECILRSR
jgi:CMP-N-acetylneuraminic acid synthetase